MRFIIWIILAAAVAGGLYVYNAGGSGEEEPIAAPEAPAEAPEEAATEAPAEAADADAEAPATAAETVEGVVEEAVEGATEAAEGAAEGAIEAVEGAVEGVVSGETTAEEAVDGAIEGVTGAAEEALEGATEAVEGAIEGVLGTEEGEPITPDEALALSEDADAEPTVEDDPNADISESEFETMLDPENFDFDGVSQFVQNSNLDLTTKTALTNILDQAQNNPELLEGVIAQVRRALDN